MVRRHVRKINFFIHKCVHLFVKRDSWRLTCLGGTGSRSLGNLFLEFTLFLLSKHDFAAVWHFDSRSNCLAHLFSVVRTNAWRGIAPMVRRHVRKINFFIHKCVHLFSKRDSRRLTCLGGTGSSTGSRSWGNLFSCSSRSLGYLFSCSSRSLRCTCISLSWCVF